MNLIERGQLGKLFIEIEKVKKVWSKKQEYFLRSLLLLQSKLFGNGDNRSVKFMLDLDKLNKAEGELYCKECNFKECCKTEPDGDEYCIFFDTKKMKCSVYANRPLQCRLWVCELFTKEDIANICKQLNIMPDMQMLNLKTGERSKVS